jgi:hypothetical protein
VHLGNGWHSAKESRHASLNGRSGCYHIVNDKHSLALKLRVIAHTEKVVLHIGHTFFLTAARLRGMSAARIEIITYWQIAHTLHSTSYFIALIVSAAQKLCPVQWHRKHYVYAIKKAIGEQFTRELLTEVHTH